MKKNDNLPKTIHSQKYGIIDIGSNTVRLNLYLVKDGEHIVSLLNKKSVAGLSTYVINGIMTKRGADKLVGILKNFERICGYFGINQIRMFATAALRNAKNSHEVLGYIESCINNKIELISGEDEARFGYNGIKEEYQISDGYIVDIGGGSSEITLIKAGEIEFATSIPEGSLSLMNKFVDGIFPDEDEIKKMKHQMRKLLVKFDVPKSELSLPIYGVGGTIRASGNIAMDLYNLPSNREISKGTISQLYRSIVKKDLATSKMVLQVVPERIHTITQGIIILREIIKFTNASQIFVCSNGIREGYLKKVIEIQQSK